MKNPQDKSCSRGLFPDLRLSKKAHLGEEATLKTSERTKRLMVIAQMFGNFGARTGNLWAEIDK